MAKADSLDIELFTFSSTPNLMCLDGRGLSFNKSFSGASRVAKSLIKFLQCDVIPKNDLTSFIVDGSGKSSIPFLVFRQEVLLCWP